MLVWPISSPKMTRIFGLRPDGAAGAGPGAAGAAFWACANAPEVKVAAATSVDVPSRMFRRLMDLLPVLSDRNSIRSSPFALLLIRLSVSLASVAVTTQLLDKFRAAGLRRLPRAVQEASKRSAGRD